MTNISRLRNISKRLLKSMPEGSLTLMQIQHLVAQSFGFENWEDAINKPKENEIMIKLSKPQSDNETPNLTLMINGITINNVSGIQYKYTSENRIAGNSRLILDAPINDNLFKKIENFGYVKIQEVLNNETIIPNEPIFDVNVLLERIKLLKQEKWNILPYDSPADGCFGVSAWKDLGTEEVSQVLQYHPFGVMKRKEVILDDAKEFLDILFSKDSYNCDDPMTRCLGAVQYDTENKVSKVFYIPISKLKGLSDKNDIDKNKYETLKSREKRKFEKEIEMISDLLTKN